MANTKMKLLRSERNLKLFSGLPAIQLKTEFVYFDGLTYSTTGEKEVTRRYLLLGFEYKGIADTIISYDLVYRDIGEYDQRLINATLTAKTANYLIFMNSEKFDEGAFQR